MTAAHGEPDRTRAKAGLFVCTVLTYVTMAAAVATAQNRNLPARLSPKWLRLPDWLQWCVSE